MRVARRTAPLCGGLWRALVAGLLGCALAFILVDAHAEAELRRPPTDPDHGLTGVVTDHTITHQGRRFFQAFFDAWLDQPNHEGVSLTVSEKPSARWGSLILIEYRQETVFKSFVQPGRQEVEALGRQAARVVSERVAREQIEQVLMINPDLAADGW